jgi:magnesium-transporting ATPase (P-type)
MPSPEPTSRSPEETPRPWHALEPEAVLEALDSGRDGLSPEVAARRLEEHGRNELPEEAPTPAWKRFLQQFANVLIYVLLVAALVTALLGDWLETGVILAVVLINAIIGYVQEGRAEAALASLKSMLALEAVVVRGGRRSTIPAEELVPGDVVMIEAGDRVPADLRVLEAHNVRVEEAALTGESVPVEKESAAVDEAAGLGDRASLLLASTNVASGAGRGVVVATGGDTEVGRIGAMVSGVIKLRTPFLTAIDDFSRRLAFAILAIGALLFAFGTWVRGYALDEIFLTVIGFAVAAIPEGLPAVITITLALGVQRMARQRAIVRRLPAVETLGSVTVICSDKTGTLTKNEMTVRRVVMAAAVFDIGGEGYDPVGDVRHRDDAGASDDGGGGADEAGGTDGNSAGDDPQLRALAVAGALTAEAEFRDGEGGGRTLSGDPTDGAVVVLAEKLGIDHDVLRATKRLDRVPFDSAQQYAASLHEDEDGRVIYVKGAPERLLDMCDRQRRPDGSSEPLDRGVWESAAQDLASEAFRVLAVAMKRPEGAPSELRDDDAEHGLEMLGLLALIDPPREEVRTSVASCQQAGIRVVMITGDHARTARAIAAQLGIGGDLEAVTGRDLDGRDDAELEEIAATHDVFARASPEHKLRLLEALQRRGAVAAMTGDGVNDAPALKRADVGVAMGVKGSEAAKDASEMVLADDNFATIARAVEEGRAIYDNLKKTVLFVLPTNGAEALVIIVALVMAFRELPITPVQILWINMVTAVTLALALAFEPPEDDVMRRPPRDREEPILSRYLIWRVAYVSAVMGGLTLLLFFAMLDYSGDLILARTFAVNTLVACEVAYLINTRFLLATALARRHFFSNPAVFVSIAVLIVFQLLFTYTPPLQLWFGVSGLAFEHWGYVLLAGVVVFVVVEVEKWVVRARRGRRT